MTTITHPGAGQPLTTARLLQGRRVLITNSVLMLVGYFTIISVFALHFTHDLRLTAAAVGLALALRQLTQQGLDIFGGFFADHFGYRRSIAVGCFIRALGFAGMGVARTLPVLALSALVAGFGGMFFDAAGSGALAAVTPPEQRARTFALQATLNNVGAAIGPVAGIALYYRFGFLPVALLAAAIFVWIGVETAVWLPVGIERVQRRAGDRLLTLRQTFRAISQRRTYVLLVGLMMGFWMINAQIPLTVPLVGQRLGGNRGVALLFDLNAFLAIPLQYPLMRLAERYLAPLSLLGWSTLLNGVGLGMVFLAPTFGWQVAGIVIATVGGLAITPMMAAITAQIAPARALAAFYGFTALSVGLGGGIGQIFGGAIYDAQLHLHLPWLMGGFALAVSVAAAVALWRAPSPFAAPTIAPDDSMIRPKFVTAH